MFLRDFSSFDKMLVHFKLQFKMNKHFIKTRKISNPVNMKLFLAVI